MTLALGVSVGDFTFHKPDETPIHLRDFLGKPLLVIFLRHLA